MKFAITKKGYSVEQVDDYVARSEQSLIAQKERILGLKRRISSLERELSSYYEKKDLIISALSEAVKKAEEIERLANQKYDLEIVRLRQFHAKWSEYYAALQKKHPDATASATEDFNLQMDKILRETEWNKEGSSATDVSTEADVIYEREEQRLRGISSPLDRIRSYLDREGEKEQSAPSEQGVFSLEEALHPSQDLAGIMKDLGLIED